MPNLTADDLLSRLAAKRPKTHAVGQPDPLVTDSAYLDAHDRATRAKLGAQSNPLLAEANLAIANERFAQVTDVATAPIFGKTHAIAQLKTIELGEGTFEMSEVRVDNAIYKGVPGKTKVRSPDGKFAFIVNNGGIGQFFDIEFDGSAVTGEGTCTIQVTGGGATNFTRGVDVGFGRGTAFGHHNNGLKLVNSFFKRVRWHDSPGGWAGGCYTADGLLIEDCDWDTINNGWKSNNGGNTIRNYTVRRVYSRKIERMVEEIQGCGVNCLWEDTHDEEEIFPGGANYQGNINKLGRSIILHGDTEGGNRQGNLKVQRNLSRNPARPDGTGLRLVYEIGNQFEVHDNYAEGGGTFTSCFEGDSGRQTTDAQIGPTHVTNNRLVDVKWGVGMAYGPSAHLADIKADTNNANVQLSWDINRPKPGAGTLGPTPTPTAPLKLTATPQPATADIKTKGAQVKFAVSDMPALTKSVRIESRAKDHDGVTGPQVGPAPTYSLDELPAVGGMYHPAWEIDFRAVALDAAGKALATTAWVATPRMAGEIGPNGSDLAWPPVDQPPPPPPPPLGVTTENTIQRVVTDDELSALLRLRFANQPAALAVKVRVTAPAGDRTVAAAN